MATETLESTKGDAAENFVSEPGDRQIIESAGDQQQQRKSDRRHSETLATQLLFMLFFLLPCRVIQSGVTDSTLLAEAHGLLTDVLNLIGNLRVPPFVCGKCVSHTLFTRTHTDFPFLTHL